MPLVDIRFDSALVSEERILQVRSAARELAAHCLNCEDPGGSLSLDDVDAHVSPQSELDLCHYDVEITVFANYFPSRADTLETRTETIRMSLEHLLSRSSEHLPVSFFVWVYLGHAGFSDSRPT